MEYIVIMIFIALMVIIMAIICKFNMKDVKELAENKELDDIANKMPSNLEICKTILKKLNNENVTIEEDKNSQTCLYIAMTNKIIIGNLRKSYTRIQTVVHECLHSIQDKRLLKSNFVISNIYLIYFAIICILAILKLLPYKMLFLVILILLGYMHYFIRSYLENDAMTKARSLAKEYMEESNILEEQEIEKLVNQYDKLNTLGVKFTDFDLMFKTMVKFFIFTLICLVF